jgi:hypothetical protein
MTEKSKSTAATKEQAVIQGGPSQVIYADRILNVGFGPAVSRLTLGMEISPNNYQTLANVVIPTQSLMEAIDVMQQMLYKNTEVKESLINGLDSFKTRLNNISKQ